MTEPRPKEKNFVSAVIYMRADPEGTAAFIGAVGAVLEAHFENYEIVVADDCAKVDSVALLAPVAESLGGSFSIVKMSFPQGVQAAMNAGVDMAIGDFVFEFESAVLDFEPAFLMDVYDRCLAGCDVVSASPEMRQRITSKWFYRIFNKYSGGQQPLTPERFRLVSRRAINRVESMSDNVVYRKAFYRNSGLRCDVMRYRPNARHPASSLPSERSKLATDSLILFTTVAYRVSLVMTFLMMAFAVFSVIYTLVVFLVGRPIEGWTTTMLLLSIGFFGVFMILTIVIKYLSVLVELTFKKNRYTVESVRKIA